jgi:DNA-binding MarR family transcriptional regulator
MKVEHVVKSQKITTNELRAAITIFYTNNWLFEKHKKFFKKYGLTNQQYNVLRILRGQFPNPASISLIKDRMLDKMSDTSRLVERLIKLNLVVRETSTKDKRSVDVKISYEGLALLAKIDEDMPSMDNIIKKNLSESEIIQLCDLLDKLRG